MNDIGVRSYGNLAELSNVTEHLTLQLGRTTRSGLTAGVVASGGLKYYTSDLYDTTLYESARTYVEKNNGKGKAGAKLIVPSDKKILVECRHNDILADRRRCLCRCGVDRRIAVARCAVQTQSG